MMRDLLRPGALFSHVLVLTVVVTCVFLGQWQLDRLSTVRDQNARSEQRLTEPPVDLAALADPAAGGPVDEAALEYRRVEVTGTFRIHEEVLQRNNSYQGQTGFHVLTPLELTGGGVVLVNRGWVPAALSEPPVAQAAPQPGEVNVSGVLERPVGQPGWGPIDPDEGVLQRVFHADTARLDRQVEGELFTMVLRIDAEPAGAISRGELPVPPGPPTLDEANHLSYALQWHAFALIALITYIAWLYTRAKRLAQAADRTEDHGPAGGPDDGDEDGGGGGGRHRAPEPDRPLTGASR